MIDYKTLEITLPKTDLTVNVEYSIDDDHADISEVLIIDNSDDIDIRDALSEETLEQLEIDVYIEACGDMTNQADLDSDNADRLRAERKEEF